MSTQIMQSVQENELFSEMSTEEAATVSGGSAAAGSQALAGILAATGSFLTPQEALLVQATTLSTAP
ncbi:hypothetical protein NIES2111_24840 [Nostoc sp. NIES-2111]|nr:hypothetical protein NIES2111_24840 [Nostoc sp. NIES-2111]